MSTLIEKMNESSTTARLVRLILKMSADEQQSLLEELEKRFSFKKRKHDRKPYFSAVDYAARDETHTDFIQNISAGGVFIGTATPFSVGQEVTLTFPLPISQERISILGEIAWASEKGIGVKFKIADYRQEAMIKSLVNMI
ncbi:MAG: PilZ domain-containing protein [Deltaproteobacteria bacterium]|jgi:uncharacterized protein (TIGR02266 family)|nr:MAG: PilZ domain-containing protein [Deltaproteobacteria bacterium]